MGLLNKLLRKVELTKLDIFVLGALTTNTEWDFSSHKWRGGVIDIFIILVLLGLGVWKARCTRKREEELEKLGHGLHEKWEEFEKDYPSESN